MMKQLSKIFCFLLLFVVNGVYADLDSGIFGSEQMAKPKSGKRPFSLYGSYDNVCRSKFQNKKFKGQSQRYAEAEAELGAVFYYNPGLEEGARARLGHTYTAFEWKQNPYFKQNHFNVASVELGFATKRLTGWLWQMNVSMNMDTDHFKLSKYANYDILLWGRYSWRPNVGYHTGFLAYTGMRVNRVWPVLGFDWQINNRWKLNAIYPLNVSLVYQFNCYFSAALAGRAFINRYRVGAHENLPQAIFEYSNSGGEFALNYEYMPWIKANAHVGRTLGGQIRISNRNHHHTKHLDIDSAYYFGGNLEVSF